MATLTNKALLAQLADATGLNQVLGPDQQVGPLVPLPQRIAALQGVDTEDADGLPTDIAGMRSLIRTMLGQQQMPSGPNWRMSAYQNATRIDALVLRLDVQQAQIVALTDLLGATRADLVPRMALAEAAQLANATADAAEAAKQEQLRLKTVALESKQQTSDTAHALLEAKQLQAEAAQALLQSQLTQNAAAIALAQQAAQAADAKAVAAQSTATAAKAKADADEQAAAEARSIAIAARDLANANQVALTTLSGRFRLKRLPVPAIGIGQTGTLNVMWDTPFADDNYNAVAQVEGVALLGLAADVTARTKDGCTVQLKNGLGITITLASATVSVTATHS